MERNINLFVSLVFGMLYALTSQSQVSKVEVTTNVAGHFELHRNGVPYYIKGAGAKDHFDLLPKSGANSIRIWSTNNGSFLDSAHQHDLTVALGLYVRPERSGMDYNDEYAVKGQTCKQKEHTPTFLNKKMVFVQEDPCIFLFHEGVAEKKKVSCRSKTMIFDRNMFEKQN